MAPPIICAALPRSFCSDVSCGIGFTLSAQISMPYSFSPFGFVWVVDATCPLTHSISPSRALESIPGIAFPNALQYMKWLSLLFRSSLGTRFVAMLKEFMLPFEVWDIVTFFTSSPTSRTLFIIFITPFLYTRYTAVEFSANDGYLILSVFSIQLNCICSYFCFRQNFTVQLYIFCFFKLYKRKGYMNEVF